MYFYIKALHIIFICTWFAGLFYIVRLFIYYTEANEKSKDEKRILQDQLGLMMTRLWKIITVPSAVITLLLGVSMWHLIGATPKWLILKLVFVIGLYVYHFYLGGIRKQLLRSHFRYSSYQLRILNELATLFLFAIVFLVVVKDLMSPLYGIIGLAVLGLILMGGIKLYRKLRHRNP